MKSLKNPISSITKATLQILIAQKANKCVPDYIIPQVCLNTGLTDAESREVRDIVQSREFEGLCKS